MTTISAESGPAISDGRTHRISRVVGWLALAGFVATLVYFWYLPPSNEYWAQQREAAALKDPASWWNPYQQNIEIAIVWPRRQSHASIWDHTPGLTATATDQASFIHGVQLAVQKINEEDGGVLLTGSDGTTYSVGIQARYFDEQDSQTGVAIARQVAAMSHISAVIGHATDSVVPASVIYNSSKLPMIVPTSTDPSVTLHGFDFVYRTAPRDAALANAMVEATRHLSKRKTIRVALFYPAILPKKMTEVTGEETGEQAEAGKDVGSTPEADTTEHDGEYVDERLKFEADRLIESAGNRVSFQVRCSYEYERGRKTHRHLIDTLLTRPDLFDVILIADQLTDAALLRAELEEAMRETIGDAEAKPILDLNRLEWPRVKDLYGFLSSKAQIDDFFVQAARLVLRETKENVIILSTRDSYGTRLGAAIRTSVNDRLDDPLTPLRLLSQKTYNHRRESYLPLVASVLEEDSTDYILLAGVGRESVDLIRQLREGGMDKPIICPLGLEADLIFRETHSFAGLVSLLDSTQLQAVQQALEEGDTAKSYRLLRSVLKFQGSEAAVRGYIAETKAKTFVASTFDSRASSPKTAEFVARYNAAYRTPQQPDIEPDSLAALGYHNVYLLKAAFERAGTTDPTAVAAAMTLLVEEDGIFGKTRFSKNGDLLGLKIIFKTRNLDGAVRKVQLDTPTAD